MVLSCLTWNIELMFEFWSCVKRILWPCYTVLLEGSQMQRYVKDRCTWSPGFTVAFWGTKILNMRTEASCLKEVFTLKFTLRTSEAFLVPRKFSPYKLLKLLLSRKSFPFKTTDLAFGYTTALSVWYTTKENVMHLNFEWAQWIEPVDSSWKSDFDTILKSIYWSMYHNVDTQEVYKKR